MTEKRVLTRGQMKASYPNQWLLVAVCELNPSTSLHKGRVVAHSKDRGEIHRALKEHSGHLCIYFTGSPLSGYWGPVLMARVSYDPAAPVSASGRMMKLRVLGQEYKLS